MLKQVWVSNDLKQSLETAKWMGTGVQGFLIGRMLNEQLCIQNVWKSNASNPNKFLEDFQQCCLHLTGGTIVLGIVFVAKNSLTDDMLTALQSLPGDIQNAAAKNPFVLCILQPVAGKQVASFHLLGNEGKVTELTEQPEEDLDKRIVTFRIKAQITLHLYVDSGKSPNTETWANKVRKAVSSVDEALTSGHFSYGIHESSVFLKESNIVGPKSLYTCQDLCAFINENDNVTHNRKKKVTPDQSPVVVDMYRLINGEDNSFAHPSCAPAVHHKKGSFLVTDITLPLDVLVEVHETETLSNLFQVLTNAVKTQLQAMKESLLQHSKENLFHIPEPFHFTIPSRHTCVTVIYPRGFSESDLESKDTPFISRCALQWISPFSVVRMLGYFLAKQQLGDISLTLMWVSLLRSKEWNASFGKRQLHLPPLHAGSI
ncbi:uncharacterized protein LOC112558730 isoform X3 [Pomacea canaliculata]|uniref:uncharacterized protein LOC112558730 isoform X3 n=1 Tax=Pomacea canaliculata TaxID=400727 RepID=UPI000D72A033|nr:uncharacterized protein LOC112558730 isoform X3 [Pomacea canaliculata]